MSNPRIALIVSFGLISSSGCMRVASTSTAVAEAQAPAKAVPAPSGTKIVRIIVVPDDKRGRRAEIESWARQRGNIGQWDILVDGRTPWMFMHDTLIAHDHNDHHFELVAVHISVGKKEQVRWQSDRPFCITEIKRDKHEPPKHKDNAPPNPFPLLKAQMDKSKESCSGADHWVDSGPAQLTAAQMPQRYKVSFRIGGELVDPDIVCEP